MSPSSVVIGYSVSGAGDINGDGIDDLIIGVPYDDFNSLGGTLGESNAGVPFDAYDNGAAYVVFGSADTDTVDLSEVAQGNGGFAIYGVGEKDLTGKSVSGAGDVNGDGLDDLIIGANGAAYVVFGKTHTNSVQLLGHNGFTINGNSDNAVIVSSAGDINGDGLDDLIIGADGAAYAMYGKTDSDTVEISDVALGIGGFVIDGSGAAVSSAGDVNGDGFDDLIIGASGVDATGASYVIYGGLNTEGVIIGSEGSDTLNGTAGADQIVGGAGDDTLVGLGGADVLRGGEGDDILAISSTNYASLDGGNGTDTLRLDTTMTLDFTRLSDNEITSIEQIDLRFDGGNSIIELNLTDVLNFGGGSSDNSFADLIIFATSGDTVTLDDSSDGQEGLWTEGDILGALTAYNFESFASNDILATVLVSSSIEGVI